MTKIADEFWLDVVRRHGQSNAATDAFATLEETIVNGNYTESQLRFLSTAFRSLAGKASDRASEVEARRRRPWEFKDKQSTAS